MSYSFGFRAATKAEAKEKIAAELCKVVVGQSVHAKDAEHAKAAANAFVDLLDTDESKDVTVSMSGSLAGNWSGSDLTSISGANVSVSAHLVAKTA